jgi:hypothetical protein
MKFRDDVVVSETSGASYKRGATSRNYKNLNIIAARA